MMNISCQSWQHVCHYEHTHTCMALLMTTIREPVVGVQVREGAGGDEVDDAAGVHRVAAQVSEYLSIPSPNKSPTHA
jgi:hypothetical protein